MCCQHNVIKLQLKCTPPQLKLISQSMGKVNFSKIIFDMKILKFYSSDMPWLTLTQMQKFLGC